MRSVGRNGQTCSCERTQDASVGQVLHLNNGRTLNDKLRGKDSRVAKWLSAKVSDETVVQDLYMLALSREPTATERTAFTRLLSEATADTSRREAIEDLFWAVLTSREFVFNR